MSYQLSACVFIRDNNEGAFCLFESMASYLHLVDEYVIFDLGSKDGTYNILQNIATKNPKISLYQQVFPKQDASAFAILANDVVRATKNPYVFYHQADEIMHEALLKRFEDRLAAGDRDLSFWRVQYKYNFSDINWFPHLVHRCGEKGPKFYFAENSEEGTNTDGMNTTRVWDAQICSRFGGEFFPRWGKMQPEELPVEDMIMDVSLLGGFRDNIPERKIKHAPFWGEEPRIEKKSVDHWYLEACQNPVWTQNTSKFNLPKIMRYHVGKTRYTVRPDLIEALATDNTRKYIENL